MRAALSLPVGVGLCWLAACGGSSQTALFAGGADGGGGDAGGDEVTVLPTDGGGDGAGGCATGFADCDGDPQNGCETSLLTDDGNCGGCGRAHACTTGQSCQSGACTAGPATVVPGGTFQVGDAACLAVDATAIYVTSARSNGDVYRAMKAGGAAVSIANGQAVPRGIVVDRSHVYWGNGGSGAIVRANLDGTSAQPIYTGAPGVFALAHDQGAVFFTNNAQGYLWRVDKDGQNPRQLHPVTGALGQGHAVTVDVRGGFAFFTDGQAGQLIKVGTTATLGGVAIISGFSQARGVAVDSNTAYITAGGNGGQVLSVPASSTSVTVPTQVAQNQPGAAFVATDGQSLYWSNSVQNGSIGKRAPNGNVGPLVTGQAFPQCVAVDASSIYWINGQGAAVMRVAK